MLPSLISTCKRTLVCRSRSTDIVSNISFRAGAFTESIRCASIFYDLRIRSGAACPCYSAGQLSLSSSMNVYRILGP